MACFCLRTEVKRSRSPSRRRSRSRGNRGRGRSRCSSGSGMVFFKQYPGGILGGGFKYVLLSPLLSTWGNDLIWLIFFRWVESKPPTSICCIYLYLPIIVTTSGCLFFWVGIPVGGHDFNLWVGVTAWTHHPKKGTKNCQVGNLYKFKPSFWKI